MLFLAFRIYFRIFILQRSRLLWGLLWWVETRSHGGGRVETISNLHFLLLLLLRWHARPLIARNFQRHSNCGCYRHYKLDQTARSCALTAKIEDLTMDKIAKECSRWERGGELGVSTVVHDLDVDKYIAWGPIITPDCMHPLPDCAYLDHLQFLFATKHTTEDLSGMET